VLLMRLHRELTRYGFTDLADQPDKTVDLFKLDKVLASGNVDRDNRWRIKSCLGQLGLLR
jgi:hypothetical protein